MTHNYLSTFAELIVTPFEHIELIWGIVPLYFGLLLNEMTPDKANFRTATQTGFSFLWAAAQWLYPYFVPHAEDWRFLNMKAIHPINLFVSLFVLACGLVALYSGIRKKFPKYMKFLGYTRFANYFMIAVFAIQAHALLWTWERFIAIILFAVPCWLLLHFGLMPVRDRK